MAASAPDELRALTRLAFDELGGATGGIGQIHQAIADRAFGAAGSQASPSRVAHDAISRGVYAGLRGAAMLAGRAAAGAASGGERACRPRRAARPCSR